MIRLWKEQMKEALILKTAQFQHMSQICIVEEAVWHLYERILKREYKQYEKKKP